MAIERLFFIANLEPIFESPDNWILGSLTDRDRLQLSLWYLEELVAKPRRIAMNASTSTPPLQHGPAVIGHHERTGGLPSLNNDDGHETGPESRLLEIVASRSKAKPRTLRLRQLEPCCWLRRHN